MIKNTLLVNSTIPSLLECFKCVLCYTHLQLKLENSVTALTSLNVTVPTLFHSLSSWKMKVQSTLLHSSLPNILNILVSPMN